jgi:restriction endonuclease S subunit
MRKGWMETTIGTQLTLEYGRPLTEPNRDGVGYPVFGSAGVVGMHSEPLVSEGQVIVVGRKGTAGAVYWSHSPCFVIDTAYFVQRKTDIDSRFLFLLLTHLDLKSVTAQTGVPGLNRERAYSLKCKIPPLHEQKRIVDLIASVDSYIDALRQQLEKAKISKKALVESLVLGLSSSTPNALRDLSTKIGSGATPRGGEDVYIESGINLIRSQNIHDSKFVKEGLVAIAGADAKLLENVTVETDDVLINITGASVTRCCLVDSGVLPARVNQHVAIIRTRKELILPKYLVLLLTSNGVKGYLNDIAGSGSTRQALTKAHLEDLRLPTPPLPQQSAVIEVSDSYNFAISNGEEALSAAKLMRSGLMLDLLSGEHEIPASYDKVIGAA